MGCLVTRIYISLLDTPGPGAWTADAACAGIAGFDDPSAVGAALAVCATCPVTEPCGAYGVEIGGTGVWGGRVIDPGCVHCGRPLHAAQPERRYCGHHDCQGARRREQEEEARGAPARYRVGETTHGTAAGVRWHYRHGEKPCEDCRQAEKRRAR